MREIVLDRFGAKSSENWWSPIHYDEGGGKMSYSAYIVTPDFEGALAFPPYRSDAALVTVDKELVQVVLKGWPDRSDADSLLVVAKLSPMGRVISISTPTPTPPGYARG